jgi:hypothetical protein
LTFVVLLSSALIHLRHNHDTLLHTHVINRRELEMSFLGAFQSNIFKTERSKFVLYTGFTISRAPRQVVSSPRMPPSLIFEFSEFISLSPYCSAVICVARSRLAVSYASLKPCRVTMIVLDEILAICLASSKVSAINKASVLEILLIR